MECRSRDLSWSIRWFLETVHSNSILGSETVLSLLAIKHGIWCISLSSLETISNRNSLHYNWFISSTRSSKRKICSCLFILTKSFRWVLIVVSSRWSKTPFLLIGLNRNLTKSLRETLVWKSISNITMYVKRNSKKLRRIFVDLWQGILCYVTFCKWKIDITGILWSTRKDKSCTLISGSSYPTLLEEESSSKDLFLLNSIMSIWKY